MPPTWYDESAPHVAALPADRWGHAVYINPVERIVYALGGRNDTATGNPGNVAPGVIERPLDGGEWVESAIPAPAATIGSGTVHQAAATWHEGRAYLAGGFQQRLLSLSPAGGEWDDLGALPDPEAVKRSVGLVSAPDGLWYRDADSTATTGGRWHKWNGLAWDSGAPQGGTLATQLWLHQTRVVVEDEILEFSGLTRGNSATAIGRAYDRAADSWRQLAPAPTTSMLRGKIGIFDEATRRVYFATPDLSGTGATLYYDLDADEYAGDPEVLVPSSISVSTKLAYNQSHAYAAGVVLRVGGLVSFPLPGGALLLESAALGTFAPPATASGWASATRGHRRPTRGTLRGLEDGARRRKG